MPSTTCGKRTRDGGPCSRPLGPKGCPYHHTTSRPPRAPESGAASGSSPAVTLNPMAHHQPTAPGRSLPHYQLDGTKRRVNELVTWIREGIIAVDPPYQRGAVWTDEQRTNLVKSMQLGLPLHAVIVSDRGVNESVAGRPQFVVVDGRQRLETFLAWWDGKVSAPADWFEADEVDPSRIAPDGTITRDGLTDLGRRMTANRWLIGFHEVNGLTVEQEADLYLLVNFGGVAQTDADRQRAAAMGTGQP